jgi:5'-nucleotidase
MSVVMAVLATIALVVPAGALAAKPGVTPPHAVNVQLLAINDFHGNLEPPGGSGGRVGVAANDQACVDAGPASCVLAGGVAYLADDIKNLEATNPNTLVVSAGDNIGASPLLSAAFHDEPTVEALNELGLDVSAVGNHEFDEGVTELLRIQNGGCNPTDGCETGHDYEGADFPLLAANFEYKDSGEPIRPAYTVGQVGGVQLGFIGLTLEGTPNIVSAAGIQNVNFLDEATTINTAADALRSQGVKTIVVLLHEGGAQSVSISPTAINTCTCMSGAIVDIVQNLSDKVDMVVSGHTHNAYNCQLPNSAGEAIPVSSAASFGRLVTDIDLRINSRSGRPMTISVNNTIVFRDTADAAEAELVSYYRDRVAPIANAVVGSITADITNANNANGESALGDVIADGQYEYTQATNAQFAFMNPGGIRTSLIYAASVGGEQPGQITYGETFAVQPFNNLVATQDMTGAQIKTVLEQSFKGCFGRTQDTVILQVSAQFHYAYDTTRACGDRITAMTLNGSPLDAGTTYKVTMNNFLADGGDSFPGFREGTNRVNQPGFDVDALAQYIGLHSPVAPGPQDRITKVN